MPKQRPSDYDPRPAGEVPHDQFADLAFALPPLPARMADLLLTANQGVVMRFLQTWHWRWCPSAHNIEESTGIEYSVLKSTLRSLRRLGFISWVPKENHTLHLTPLGQNICGIFVGAVSLEGEPALLRMPVEADMRWRTALGPQRVWRSRRQKGQPRRKYHRIPDSVSAFRAWRRGWRSETNHWPKTLPAALRGDTHAEEETSDERR